MGKSVHLTETEWVGIAAFLGAAGVQIAGSAIPHWVGWLLLVIAAYIAISSAHRRIKAKQHDDEMSATDVLKRIAFESEWAVTRDFSSPADHWQETMWEVPLGREFLRPLASGDIVARGIRSTKEGEEYGHSDIPADFWRNAKLEPHADRLMCEPGYDYIFGEGVMYGDIRLRKADVDRLWPARSKSQMQSRPSPFIEKAEDWKQRHDELMAQRELEIAQLRSGALQNTEATSPRYKEILQALAPPLARVYELAMTYGHRDLAGITAAKNEARMLVAEIPYDDGTTRTVRDFLNYCDRLIADWQDRADERPSRAVVHAVSVGLFRFLHEGKPVDRTKIDLPEDER